MQAQVKGKAIQISVSYFYERPAGQESCESDRGVRQEAINLGPRPYWSTKCLGEGAIIFMIYKSVSYSHRGSKERNDEFQYKLYHCYGNWWKINSRGHESVTKKAIKMFRSISYSDFRLKDKANGIWTKRFRIWIVWIEGCGLKGV